MGARLAFLLAALPVGVLAYLSSEAAFADVKAGTVDAGKPADDAMAACMAAGQKALDLEKLGKLLDARTQLAICAAPACGQYVAPACQKHADDITAKLPSILFLPKDSEGSELQGVEVTIDGGDTRTLDGKPITVDPGPHTFRFEALGLRPSERTFVLVEGAQGRQEPVIVGVTESPPADASSAAPAEASSAAAAEGPPAPGPTEATPTPSAEATPDAGTPVATESASLDRSGENAPGAGNKTPAYVVGGAGALAIAVGAVLGGMAFSEWSSSQSDCSTTSCSASARPRALSEHDTAKAVATGSTVAFVVGGAALAVGAYLYFTTPGQTKNPRPTATLAVGASASPTFAGLSMHGAFQ